LTKKLGDDYRGRISEWDYCGAFFAVQAMMHEGDTFWRRWWCLGCGTTLSGFRIRMDPGPSITARAARAYATALSILVLQAPQRLLPHFPAVRIPEDPPRGWALRPSLLTTRAFPGEPGSPGRWPPPRTASPRSAPDGG
jgi:hypothetical protein